MKKVGNATLPAWKHGRTNLQEKPYGLTYGLTDREKTGKTKLYAREALETHADERNKASQSDEKKLEMQLYQLASMVAPMYHRASLMDSQTEKKVGKSETVQDGKPKTAADKRNKASQRDEKKLETQLYQLESVVARLHQASKTL